MVVRNTQVALYELHIWAAEEDLHTVMPAPGLLGKDAAYWQSVHQAGQGLLKDWQEAAKKTSVPGRQRYSNSDCDMLAFMSRSLAAWYRERMQSCSHSTTITESLLLECV